MARPSLHSELGEVPIVPAGYTLDVLGDVVLYDEHMSGLPLAALAVGVEDVAKPSGGHG